MFIPCEEELGNFHKQIYIEDYSRNEPSVQISELLVFHVNPSMLNDILQYLIHFGLWNLIEIFQGLTDNIPIKVLLEV